MGELIYASNMSLDGFTEDADGQLPPTVPDDDLFLAITETMRSAGTYLYGRRMYETLAPWEMDPSLAAASELRAEYARVWQAPDKVVYSTTLPAVSTAHTRLERHFDSEAVRAMKASSDHDLLIGGPTLAAEAFAAGLVDRVTLWLWPILLGGTKPALPGDQQLDLDLVDERRFPNGVVELTYRVR